MYPERKIIGTSIPLFSLRSENSKNHKNGTINDGIIFLDWLKKTDQSAWQMLPIHETALIKNSRIHVNSPYKGYGIGIDPKYLSQFDLKPDSVELTKFMKKNEYWLSDYALFCALRDRFNTDDWTTWEKDISNRNGKSIHKWKVLLQKEIEKHIILQWQLHTNYEKLKQKAKEKNIRLIGDIQFYLPLHSPLAWVNQNLFVLNTNGSLSKTSGVPYRKDKMYGRQVWGHPLYKWGTEEINRKINELFMLRIKYLSSLFNTIRIDHASGFFRYGVIDLNNPQLDSLETGPGFTSFEYIVEKARSFGIEVYAEDAGYDLGELRTAMHNLNVPGVRVLRCAYDEVHKLFLDDHVDIYNYPDNCVVYTSTHDTETLLGFIKKLDIEEKKLFADKLKIEYNSSDIKFAENLRNILFYTPSKYLLVPLQDWMLTTERINIPGTESENENNWLYRITSTIEKLPLAKPNF